MFRTKYIYGLLFTIFGALFFVFAFFALNNRYARPEDRRMTYILGGAQMCIGMALLVSSYIDSHREFFELERRYLEACEKAGRDLDEKEFALLLRVPKEEATNFFAWRTRGGMTVMRFLARM